MPRVSTYDDSFLKSLEDAGCIEFEDGTLFLNCADKDGGTVGVPLSRFVGMPKSAFDKVAKKYAPETPAIVLRAISASKKLVADGLITKEEAEKMVADAKKKAAETPAPAATLPGTEPAK